MRGKFAAAIMAAYVIFLICIAGAFLNVLGALVVKILHFSY